MVEKKKIWINGKIYDCDVIFKDDRNYISLSSLKQANITVGYNADNKIPSIGNTIKNTEITINKIKYNIPTININDFNYVNLRDIIKAVGKTVEYDNNSKSIYVK